MGGIRLPDRSPETMERYDREFYASEIPVKERDRADREPATKPPKGRNECHGLLCRLLGLLRDRFLVHVCRCEEINADD
jgi:hypothetical protein